MKDRLLRKLRNKRFVALLGIIAWSIITIVLCSLTLENRASAFAQDMKTTLKPNVNISVVNATGADVEIDKKDLDNIKIYIKEDNNINEDDFIVKPSFEVEVTSSVGLNVRENPDIESNRIDRLEYKEKVKVKPTEGSWFKLCDSEGWIYKDHVVLVE